jgi:HD-GYP domain-containing protein (c-di-GMP phosphodiesterase class II)
VASTKSQSSKPEASLMPELNAAELLVALGYAIDLHPRGCYYHGWRVALAAHRLATDIAPDIQRDVFFAGLLHDAGAVGCRKHITHLRSAREHLDDPCVCSHAQRGAALLNWLPGMGTAALYVASHHECWDGSGYPDGISGDSIPVGSLLLSLASIADIAGCFRPGLDTGAAIRPLAAMSGRAWPREVWDAFARFADDAAFLRELADPASIARLVAERARQLKLPSEMENGQGVERTLHLFAALVDLKDPSTAGHSLRTAQRAQALAGFMELTEDEAHLAYRAGLVHDCGRLGVDTDLINKPGRLSEHEMDIVRGHARMTIDALGCLPDSPGMTELGTIAGHDHERFDGNGYPDGLAGRSIPLLSRILSVVDAFDSMVSPADYRLLTPRGAIVRIQQGAGTQFDPDVVDYAVNAFNRGVIHERRNLATRPLEYKPAA